MFRKPELLDECIEVALNDDTFRADDLEFTFAARVSTSESYRVREILMKA